ncbi:MAG: L-serine ammonia-lyase [Alphaproteobacteria bacterium]
MADKKEFEVDYNHLSVADMFKLGVGPSSSHTVGPMLAGWMFGTFVIKEGLLEKTEYIQIDLFGSLALTGKGHVTDVASIVGVCGNRPDEVKSEDVPRIIDEMRSNKTINFMNKKVIPFVEETHLVWHYDEFLPEHPNGMRLTAFDGAGGVIIAKEYLSVGGGFVVEGGHEEAENMTDHNISPKYPYHSADELLEVCKKNKISIAQLQKENEKSWRSEQETNDFLDSIRDTMFGCIENGIKNTGVLPGGLNIKRRAPELHENLQKNSEIAHIDPLTVLDWVNLYALAVNEENAACGKVVTAPTNGAAGVIPAVLKYYKVFCHGTDEGIREFLLVAGAIGTLYKKRASISAAAVGCQGEVGVACSMAAAGLTAVLGGTNEQIENAAEIGMEHNLGLTCDPIDGLVQVPCIERNTMGAVKAINASRLSLKSDGKHFVSLDSCIETMRQTGEDMQDKYKETSLGGLAVNTIEC